MNRSSLAVVIPTWNSRRFLEPCIDSVAPQVERRDDIVVVDNGSTDGGRELVAELGVTAVALPRNLGFAAAINRGVAATDAELIFVLNVDTRIASDCIERLIAVLHGDKSLGGVQPRLIQLNTDPPRIYSAGQELRRDGRAFERGAGDLDGPDFHRALEVFGVCGAACVLRRELFDELGGYDERYFAFHEDVDLNARARLAGWRFRYEPGAVVYHAGNAVWRSVAREPIRFNTQLVARNRLATDVKVMPASRIPNIAVAELGALARSIRRGAFRAALSGRLAVVPWLPDLVRERRRLRRREGDATLLRSWLT